MIINLGSTFLWIEKISIVWNQRSKLEQIQLQLTIQKHKTILLWESVLINSSMKCDSKTNYEFKKEEWNVILYINQ